MFSYIFISITSKTSVIENCTVTFVEVNGIFTTGNTMHCVYKYSPTYRL